MLTNTSLDRPQSRRPRRQSAALPIRTPLCHKGAGGMELAQDMEAQGTVGHRYSYR